MAASAADPPGPIPNPVVTCGSAGEYCGGDSVGGEAVAGTPQGFLLWFMTRGGAVAARWAHNPKVAGSNPAPATPTSQPPDVPDVRGLFASLPPSCLHSAVRSGEWCTLCRRAVRITVPCRGKQLHDTPPCFIRRFHCPSCRYCRHARRCRIGLRSLGRKTHSGIHQRTATG